MGKLDGRVAIVTGGAQGIGRAIVEKLGAEGATVVVGDVAAADAEAAATAVGGRAIPTDIAEPEQVRNLVDTTVRRVRQARHPRQQRGDRARSRRGTTSTSRSGGASCASTSTARSS